MMLKQEKRSILKDRIIRKRFLKVEIKKIILKSIIRNSCIKNIIKCKAIYKYSKIKHTESISRQNNNICLISGRYKGIVKNTNLSRHTFKKIGSANFLQNFKIAS